MSSQKIQIKKLDASIQIPEYQTNGSVGFDLAASQQVTINPGEIMLIPTGLVVKVPSGLMLMLVSRSSTPRKKGLTKPHSIGIIDQDYCGETDELKIQVYNFTEKSVTIEKGDRIAQGIFVPVIKAEFLEVTSHNQESRGGFGSTG
jgi:dUTP pyrophosphatase